jgi:hypothetical protein
VTRFVRLTYRDQGEVGTIYQTSRSSDQDEYYAGKARAFLEDVHPGAVVEGIVVVAWPNGTPTSDADEVVIRDLPGIVTATA